MSSRTELDQLAGSLAAIQSHCSKSGLAIVNGWVEEGQSSSTVHWDVSNDESYRDFLNQANACNAAFVVLFSQRLTQSEWDNARTLAQESEIEDRAQELEALKPYIGHLAVVELRWVAAAVPGAVCSWHREASWFDAFYDGAEGGAERNSDVGIGASRLSETETQKAATTLAGDPAFQRAALDPDEAESVARGVLPSRIVEAEWGFGPVLSRAIDLVRKQLEGSADVKRLAVQLANDERFQRAKNSKQRRYAAEQVLGAGFAEHFTKLSLVIDHATTIHEIDIRKGRSPAH